MTTLQEVYCRPKTQEEHNMFPYLGTENYDGVFYHDELGMTLCFSEASEEDIILLKGKKEIPVKHFLDLLNDSIVAWRIEEVGFIPIKYNSGVVVHILNLPHNKICVEIYPKGFEEQFGAFQVFARGTNYRGIKTFTDLLTQIRFLSPPK